MTQNDPKWVNVKPKSVISFFGFPAEGAPSVDRTGASHGLSCILWCLRRCLNWICKKHFPECFQMSSNIGFLVVVNNVLAFDAIIISNISIPTTYTVHIRGYHVDSWPCTSYLEIHPHPLAFDQSKVGLGGASASKHQHIGGRSDTTQMKWKWHQNYRTTIQKQFVMSFPEFVAQKYQTSLYNSSVLVSRALARSNELGGFGLCDCRLLHSSLFLGHSTVVSSTQKGSFSDFKYGFNTAKHDKCLEKKDVYIVLGKLRLPRLPWWSLVVWTTRIHL